MSEPVVSTGMIGGMFFEYYMFDPLTNFTQEDLVVIARFIDVAFDLDLTAISIFFFGGTVVF